MFQRLEIKRSTIEKIYNQSHSYSVVLKHSLTSNFKTVAEGTLEYIRGGFVEHHISWN